MARVSIKNIAEKLGISSASVSLVLNGKGKNGRISEELTAKILQTAKEMNYRPNMAARSLKTGLSKTIGLLVADVSNPFFAKLARHIENAADKKNYQVMFGSSDESCVKFSKLANLFIEKSVDGVIVAPTTGCGSVIMQIEASGIPTVMVDRTVEDIPVSSVVINNYDAAYRVATHLINEGCRRIGFMAYNMELSNIKKRHEGYLAALKEAGLPTDDHLVKSVCFENFEENIQKELDSLLSYNVDSIVFATNRVGLQSLSTLQKSNRIGNLKFGSIDNPDEYKISGIPIISVEQPIEELGNRALELLYRRINDPKYKVVETVYLQGTLVL